MKSNKYVFLLNILEEEKKLLSVNDFKTNANRLAEINEIKKAFYPCQIELVNEFLSENPDTEVVKKEYAEYYKAQKDKKKKRIREYLDRLNKELVRSRKTKQLKQEKEEDELLNFILWCIFSRDATLICMITEDLFLSSVMLMIAGDNKLKFRRQL